MDSIVYKNLLAWRGCEKLFLDTQSSDISFIFRSENSKNIEKVPAHKCILSATSPVFGALFYGSHKQDGDIEIVDATPEAFKEFLQFFYRNQVKLTTENVPDVMILCKRYRLDDWQSVLNACNNVCKSSLTLDKMCWGYELAILSESNELKTFCEDEIRKNATEIFRSNSFLKCQPNLLRHILQLDSLKCNESEVFDGCIAWAKAECLRKGCDENVAQNLRAQLGDLFYEIRFGDMTHADFHKRYRMYDGLFSMEEFRDITMMIASKEFRSKKFNHCPRSHHTTLSASVSSKVDSNDLICSRLLTPDALDHVTINFDDRSSMRFLTPVRVQEGPTSQTFSTTFTSSTKQHLKKLEYFLPTKEESKFDVQMLIYEKSVDINSGILISYEKFGCPGGRTTDAIEFSTPILINAKVNYTIEFVTPYNNIGNISNDFTKIIKMEDGTIINFLCEGSQIITGLHFIKCDKKN